MNLFARIVSHGFALAVVALLALGLVYRGELFPEWELPEFLALEDKTEAEPAGEAAEITPAPVEEVSAEQATRQADAEPLLPPETGTGTDEARAEGTVIGTDLTTMETEEEAPQFDLAPPADTAPAAEAAEAAEVAEETGTAAPEAAALPGEVVQEEEAPPAAAEQAPVTTGQMSTGQIDAGMTPAELPGEVRAAAGETAAEAAAATTGETAAADVVEPAATEDGEPAAAAPATRAAPAATPYQVLAAAREAYWLRDYAVAEQKYQELIALDPDNPDGYGELGNMYFSQGDWEKASAAYYEAGTRLAAQGMYERARQLVEVIRGLNGVQADDLEQQISAAESAAS